MKARQSEAEAVLEISDLKVTFHTYAGDVKALNGVDLTVRKGEVLGLVGESGCGKSVTSLAVAGLLPPNAELVGGKILLGGADLLHISKEDLRKKRLTELAMVFQDPMTYLNPVLTVGSQITEIITQEPRVFLPALVGNRIAEIDATGKNDGELAEEKQKLLEISKAGRAGRRDVERLARAYVVSVLRSVRLPLPEKILQMFPFELSGGMRQRVMIAMALVRKPRVLLADEMTTALDVTVQAQILQLLRELRNEIDASIVLITHDLAVVAEVCDRVAVMYAGNIVEVADVEELFVNPLHPYTRGLLGSIPRVDSASPQQTSIGGSVPNLIFPPPGCRFNPRCPKAFERCPLTKPNLIETKPGHFVACFLYGE